jgi:hypothetical protein
MECPLCHQRKAGRGCPALNQTICAVCCATKRLTEIPCPPDCGYLAASREHPAAVVRRQHERDMSAILPTLRGLSERQHQLFFLLQTIIAKHKPEGFVRLMDDDVAEAAGVVAATLETSLRGVLYEHSAHSRPARGLAAEIKTFIAEIGQKAGTVFEREAAEVLRRIEVGARETRKVGPGETSYLAVMARLLRQHGGGSEPESQRPASSLIIPG